MNSCINIIYSIFISQIFAYNPDYNADYNDYVGYETDNSTVYYTDEVEIAQKRGEIMELKMINEIERQILNFVPKDDDDEPENEEKRIYIWPKIKYFFILRTTNIVDLLKGLVFHLVLLFTKLLLFLDNYLISKIMAFILEKEKNVLLKKSIIVFFVVGGMRIYLG